MLRASRLAALACWPLLAQAIQAQTPNQVRTEGDCSQALVYVEIKGNLQINCGARREELQRLADELGRFQREQRLSASQTRQLLAIVNKGIGSLLARVDDISSTVRLTQQTVTTIHANVQELRPPSIASADTDLVYFNASFHHARLLTRLQERPLLDLRPAMLATLESRQITRFAEQLAALSPAPAASRAGAELAYVRGVTEVLRFDNKAALPHFRKAYEAFPKDADYLAWFAAARFDVDGQVELALPLYRQAVAAYAAGDASGRPYDRLMHWRARSRLAQTLPSTENAEAQFLHEGNLGLLASLVGSGDVSARAASAQTHHHLARLACSERRFDEASKHWDTALSGQRELLRLDSTRYGPDLVDLLKHASRCRAAAEQAAAALKLDIETVTLLKQLLPRLPALRVEAGAALFRLGERQQSMGAGEDALRSLADALTVFRQASDEGAPNGRWWLAATLQRLASSAADLRPDDERRAWLQAAAREWRILMTLPAPAYRQGLAETLLDLSRLQMAPDPADAERLLREALTLRKDESGSQDQAILHDNLGTALWRQGRHSEAAVEHEQAVLLYRSLAREYPVLRPSLANALNNLGVTYEAVGRQAAAVPVMSEAATLSAQTLTGNDPPWVYVNAARIQYNLGRNHRDLGRLDKAEFNFKAALDLLNQASRTSYLPALRLSIDCEQALFQLLHYTMSDRIKDAEVHYRRAIELQHQLIRRNDVDQTQEQLALASTLRGAGALYSKLERWQESMSVLTEALDIYRKHLSRAGASARQDLATTMRELGVAQWNKGDRDLGQPLLEEALRMRRDLYREAPTLHKAALAGALEDMANVQQGRSLPQQAETLRQERQRLLATP